MTWMKNKNNIGQIFKYKNNQVSVLRLHNSSFCIDDKRQMYARHAFLIKHFHSHLQ
jgi:hypothetical protein